MIIITGVLKRQRQDGTEFLVLQIEGEPEVVVSKASGKPYFTTKRTTVPCTFSESVATTMLGKQMPGIIERIPCEPYSFTTSTNEVIELDFTYTYNPSPAVVEETVLG